MIALQATAAEATVDQLGWLAGCWQGVGAEPGSREQWMAPAGGTMLGMSRTVRGGKTVTHEFMRIGATAQGRTAFFAQPAARAPATFEAIKSSATEVVFENLRDDFPQRVIYRLASPTQLNASIEGLRAGVNRSIEYPMDRVSCD